MSWSVGRIEGNPLTNLPYYRTPELTDNFNRANELPISSPWVTGGTTNWNLYTNRATIFNTTYDAWLYNSNSISAGSQYIKVKDAKYGVMIKLRCAGDYISTGYSAGRYYYNSPSSSWYWRITRNGTAVATSIQIPYVSPATGCQLVLDAFENSTTLELYLYVNGILACSYIDTSPLTDNQTVGVYGNGRGSAMPSFDNFEAGYLTGI